MSELARCWFMAVRHQNDGPFMYDPNQIGIKLIVAVSCQRKEYCTCSLLGNSSQDFQIYRINQRGKKQHCSVLNFTQMFFFSSVGSFLLRKLHQPSSGPVFHASSWVQKLLKLYRSSDIASSEFRGNSLPIKVRKGKGGSTKSGMPLHGSSSPFINQGSVQGVTTEA